MKTRLLPVICLATGLAISACKSGGNQPETTDSTTTDGVLQPLPTPIDCTAVSSENPDVLPTDTAHLTEGGTAQVQHTNSVDPAPLPTGVEEYRADPGYVDNTPDPDPTEAVQVDQEAQCLNLTQVQALIQTPASARAEGIRGRVYLKVLVDPRGKIKRYVVRRSPDARLTNALVQMLDQLRYRPAFRQGQPVKSWEEFSYTFQ